jgi:hypothetical protein
MLQSDMQQNDIQQNNIQQNDNNHHGILHKNKNKVATLSIMTFSIMEECRNALCCLC